MKRQLILSFFLQLAALNEIVAQSTIQFYCKTQKGPMASVIDSSFFNSICRSEKQFFRAFQHASLQNIGKILKIVEQSIYFSNQPLSEQCLTRISLKYATFLVRASLRKDSKAIRTVIYLLEGNSFWHCGSGQRELLQVRWLLKWQRDLALPVSLYINCGRIAMVLDSFFLPDTNIKIAQIYHRLLATNILALELFIHNALKVTKQARHIPDPWSETHQHLQLTQILNTTQTNLGISGARSEFTYANKSYAEQEEQLEAIKTNILPSSSIEKIVRQLYTIFPQETLSVFLKDRLMPTCQQQIKKLKPLLILKEREERSMEDYTYNIVKVDLLKDQENAKQIGEGGTSIIRIFRMKLTYVSSSEGDNEPTHNERIETMVAVKNYKQGYNPKRDKIAHEKQIVSKLKSCTSLFLPKYFGAASVQEFSNCLLMQQLHGQELDFYVECRKWSISLVTKLTLLLNVVHGLRQLHSYSIVHLDLKPINIMVCQNLITKIFDFGQAYHQDVCGKDYIPGFSFPYVAPEVYIRFLRLAVKREDNLQFSEKQDAFALGFVLSQLFFGTRTLNLSPSKMQEVYAKREIPQRVFSAPERLEYIGDDLIGSMLGYFMIRCMDPDPQARPRAEWIGIALKLMLKGFKHIY